MKSRLIALDIDGTILDSPAGIPVPEEVREAVREARDAGARVCLCSSRPCYMMEEVTSRLDGIDALAGCSGAMIELAGASAGDLFYLDRIPDALSLACLETAKSLGAYVSFAGRERIYVLQKGVIGLLAAKDPTFTIMKEKALVKLFKTEQISSAFIITDPDVPAEAVTGAPVLKDVNVHHSGHSCFTITNKGTDKGAGVLRLAELWDIPQEAILAVGNDENDIPMLKAAGVGVAVANAVPSVFAAADWVAPSVRQAGAAAAIRRYAL
ncbi:MAG: Cof-type HAD-IIB family hydrolase [Clostridiales bacterium]|nr:Cof-type HAD-IIB family hydrolase [Clostridiales bacterium]